MILLLVLLLVNCITVLIYYLFCRGRVRSEKMSWDLSIWIRIAVMLLCPLAGCCFFLLGHLLFRAVFRPAKPEDAIAVSDPVDPDCTEMILEHMDLVLIQNAFTGTERKLLVQRMDEIGDRLYESGWRKMKSIHFEAISMRLLEIGDFEGCMKWCERAEYLFPDALATYTCLLKLYFQTGNKNGFFRVLEDLKNTDIVLDHETLELIRVFQ